MLDDYKHYWVGEAEVEKLLDKGEGWLEGHHLIARRYLRHRRSLTAEALARLVAEEDPSGAEGVVVKPRGRALRRRTRELSSGALGRRTAASRLTRG